MPCVSVARAALVLAATRGPAKAAAEAAAPAAALTAALDALPQWLLRRVLMSMHLGLRARLIKKLDAEKAGGKTD